MHGMLAFLVEWILSRFPFSYICEERRDTSFIFTIHKDDKHATYISYFDSQHPLGKKKLLIKTTPLFYFQASYLSIFFYSQYNWCTHTKKIQKKKKKTSESFFPCCQLRSNFSPEKNNSLKWDKIRIFFVKKTDSSQMYFNVATHNNSKSILSWWNS